MTLSPRSSGADMASLCSLRNILLPRAFMAPTVVCLLGDLDNGGQVRESGHAHKLRHTKLIHTGFCQAIVPQVIYAQPTHIAAFPEAFVTETVGQINGTSTRWETTLRLE